ncbi:restriction endonuclease subunit S [Pseudodesulfovibrio indicus]|uniref:Type I restriction modification DNA specificity domain-containing protein n=2 Tax=Pseudodesulfovibrio indicus TaxID=1716143 RepID=A0ABM5YSG7_9BACT|nr:restriction endonuclease subunit S [Pseudodesulfovibrio indicus]AMK10238.1 hypothetical protein AWY79_03435 [Pseudodesulfovibrio indicus]
MLAKWDRKPIGELCDFGNGYGFKASDWSERGLPIIRIQNLNGVREFNYFDGPPPREQIVVNPGELLFAWAGVKGVSFGPKIWSGPKGLLNQHIYKITPRKGVDPFWLYSTLRVITSKIEASAHGFKSSLLHVKKADIADQVVPVPTLDEQQAISQTLSTWDRAIEKTVALIAAKERRKAGLMQRLLTGKVRFGEFAGEAWKEVPLGTLFEPVTDTVGDKDIPPYSISAGIGFVSQREKWGKDIAGRQYASYTHLRKGEFAYNKGNSKKYQCGCAYLLRDQDEISVPNVFISFRPKSDKVSADFYEHFFVADYHARELKRYITSGARSDGLLNLNKKDFFKINVPCPSPREQEAIAKVLNAAVAEIDEHRNQLAALKEQKKGLMQQLLTGKVRVKS